MQSSSANNSGCCWFMFSRLSAVCCFYCYDFFCAVILLLLLNVLDHFWNKNIRSSNVSICVWTETNETEIEFSTHAIYRLFSFSLWNKHVACIDFSLSDNMTFVVEREQENVHSQTHTHMHAHSHSQGENEIACAIHFALGVVIDAQVIWVIYYWTVCDETTDTTSALNLNAKNSRVCQNKNKITKTLDNRIYFV